MLIEYRYVQGKLDRIPGLLAELQLKVDVLVSPYWPVIHAARQATRIPIVIVTTLDPVATGLVDSMAHPGGNITGLARLTQELSGKRLELLKEVIPGISRVGYLWLKDNTVPGAIGLKESEAAAHALKIQLLSLRLRSRDAQARSLSGGMVFSLLTPDESRTLR
jgi:putative ABC transport system substrate-binding protein